MSRNLLLVIMRPSTTEITHNHRREELLRREEYWACITIPLLFWLFASMTAILGFYGSKTLVIGPNYSHLFEVNELLVSHVEVSRRQVVGPMLYGFSLQPLLGLRSVWNESLSLVLEPEYHQDFRIWLNAGSKLHITCFIKSSGFFSILVSVSEGYSGLQKWVKDPSNPRAASAWEDVHGQAGSLEYEVRHNGDYFIAVGNLNQQSIAIDLLLEVNATVYSLEDADSECSLESGSCQICFPFLGKKYALLATPPSFQANATDSWEVDVTYGARWVTYLALLAFMLSVVLGSLKVMSTFTHNYHPLHEEASEEVDDAHASSPLLSPKDGDMEACRFSDVLTPEEQDAFGFQNEDGDAQLCAICLDAPKAVFFIPCGHCATCLPCGRRIRYGGAGTCPICRVKIERMRRVFLA